MAILGIDIGSSNSVLATISHKSVQVIRNELSERTTPSLVSFTGEQRLIGNHAQAKIMSNCQNTCRNIKNYLGMFYESVKEDSSSQYSLCPLKKAEYGFVGYQVQHKGQAEIYSATRVMACFLKYLVKLAKQFMNSEPSEIVIACPGWYTDIQRSALLSAVDIANLKCLKIMNEHTATALDYGIYRMSHFSQDTPTYVAFVAMGHCNTSVCIVEFTKHKLKILAEMSNRSLGGKEMDELIVNHVYQAFRSKTGLNLPLNTKHKLKLEDQASKIKKVLSANNEATCYLECFIEDYDINELITRDLFVDLCSQYIAPQFRKMMEESLIASGLSIDQISSVEMVGGCTRIPWVINSISDFFGCEPSRTLSADECVARGCALQAAMLSAHHKVTDYRCHDTINHSISLTWCSIKSFSEESVSDPLAAFPLDNFTHESLVKKGMETNIKKKIKIDSKGPLQVIAFYSDPDKLPIGTANYLGSCLVKPPSGPLQIIIEAAINFNGQFKFLEAYTMKKIEESPPASSNTPKLDTEQESGSKSETSENASNQSHNQSAHSEASENKESSPGLSDASANGNTPEKPKSQPEKATPPKYIKQKLPMELLSYPGTYAKEDIQGLKTIEIQMWKDDEAHELRSTKLNELESSIFDLRNAIRSDLASFCTKQEKDQIDQTLDKVENWIYDNYDADLAKINMVFDELKSHGQPLYDRAKQWKRIHQGIGELQFIAEKCRQNASDESNGNYPQLLEEKEKLKAASNKTDQLINIAMNLDKLNPDPDILQQLNTHYSYTHTLLKNYIELKNSEHGANNSEKSITEEFDDKITDNSSKVTAEKGFTDSN